MVSKLTESSDDSVETGEVSMFATIKNLIPEPRQSDQLRRYIGRHREPAFAGPSANLQVVPDELADDRCTARVDLGETEPEQQTG